MGTGITGMAGTAVQRAAGVWEEEERENKEINVSTGSMRDA